VIAGYFADKVYGDKAMLTDVLVMQAVCPVIEGCFADKVYGNKAMPADVHFDDGDGYGANCGIYCDCGLFCG
jgi:hypothetical protein